MKLAETPFLSRLDGCSRILVSGAGGGFDVYSGLPLFLHLKSLGKQVFLGNLRASTSARSPVFAGAWSRKEFTRRAPDGDGRRYSESIVRHCVPGLWEDELHDLTGVYVFRCPTCGELRAHWDVA
jgi:hypothetical protein